jgi:hypothetical protein
MADLRDTACAVFATNKYASRTVRSVLRPQPPYGRYERS